MSKAKAEAAIKGLREQVEVLAELVTEYYASSTRDRVHIAGQIEEQCLTVRDATHALDVSEDM